MTNPVPPGWYDDPEGRPNAECFWDGNSWTPQRRAKTPHSYQQLPYRQGWEGAQPVAASNTFSIIAFVCAGVSVLFFPIVFGPAGLILAAIALTKKERFAPIAIAAAVGCMIAGMVLGVIVWNAVLF